MKQTTSKWTAIQSLPELTVERRNISTKITGPKGPLSILQQITAFDQQPHLQGPKPSFSCVLSLYQDEIGKFTNSARLPYDLIQKRRVSNEFREAANHCDKPLSFTEKFMVGYSIVKNNF